MVIISVYSYQIKMIRIKKEMVKQHKCHKLEQVDTVIFVRSYFAPEKMFTPTPADLLSVIC